MVNSKIKKVIVNEYNNLFIYLENFKQIKLLIYPAKI